eukprot:CAMPEP_0115859954 /NCGR_PEP_ID=MMETSP0287-20121206/16879_1 /TAXON_ID=412157 /ORGANISM="Chrysochromulina rotalis, Strain UIO044" /LENGTH=338 /DNA_ID=CAMNT_0003314265 /DNA_START=42 /DNA_END=1055 /DNA_ORIENTATION=+
MTYVLSLDECVRVSEQLQKSMASDGREAELIDILSGLKASDVKGKLKFVAESKLGNTIKALAKHKDEEIKSKAVALMEAWKKMASQAKQAKAATAPAPAPVPAPVPEAKAEVKAEIKAEPSPALAAAPQNSAASSTEAAVQPEPVALKTSSSMSYTAAKRPTGKTGDSCRDKVRAKLMEAFDAGQIANARFLREQYTDTALMAEEAESHMNEVFGGTTKDYKARFRSLQFNLKDPKNPEFIRQVMTGQLHVNDLATMEVREMASDEMKKVRAQASENAKMALMDEKTYQQYAGKETQDGILKCPKCKSMKTEYIEVQTRSADEPTTKKCTCNACEYRW